MIKHNVIFFLGMLCMPFNAIANLENELPFLISVCAYNNAPWVEKNLNSIFMQQYNNFQVIYIDDASSDDTSVKVLEYIERHKLHTKIRLITNPSRQRKTKNIYNLFHTIPDETIIIQVDGDDWLNHDQVFSYINEIYQRENVWLTYGQFTFHPTGYNGSCEAVPQDIIENRSFRSWKWVYTHLRTFYAWLFKNIKLEDFINEKLPGFEGRFFPLCDDTLSYFPMLEMCGNKFAFIPDSLYIYNRDNPLLTVKIEGHLRTPASKEIRSRPQYPQIQTPIINRLERYKNAQADVVIVSKDNACGVRTLLESICNKGTGVDSIYVLYEQTKNSDSDYQKVQTAYPSVLFFPIQNHTTPHVLHDLLGNSKQEHIIIAKDTTIILEPLNIHEYIMELEKAQAYGFYFAFAHRTQPFFDPITQTNSLSHEHIHGAIYAWKFNCAPRTLCNNFDMTLHRKDIVQERAAKLIHGNCLDAFIDAWQTAEHASTHNIGLFMKDKTIEKVKPQPLYSFD